MINYVIINGVNSNTKTGLMINELPPITKPSMRTDTEEIDGRDGDIITKLGYSAYDKTITIGLWGTTYDVNDIISFFTSEGTITFSNEPDKFYKFTMVNEINVESLLRFKTASITFHCQPFKYPTEETPLEIEYEYLEQTDVESANITPTEEAPMHLSLYGNTSQTGTPTPSTPIPVNVVSGDNEVVVCGKNLFNKNAVENDKRLDGSGQPISSGAEGFSLTGYIKVKPNTKYTYSRNLTSSTYYVNICEYTSDKTHIQRLYKAGETTTTYTFTTPENCEYLRINDATTNLDNIQLEVGSTPTTYEPYQSQTYEVNLGDIELCKIGTYQDYFTKNSGKNLFDKNTPSTIATTATWTPTTTGGKFTNTGTWGTGVRWRFVLDTTKQYTLKLNNSNNNINTYIRSYTDNTYSTEKTRILQDGVGNINKTFTPDSAYVEIYFLNSSAVSNIEISYIQLELGSATTYEPYGAGLWCKYNAIGKYTFTGNETPNSITGGYYYYMSALGNITYNIGGFNTKFQFVNDDRITANDPAMYYLSDNQMAFRVGSTKDRIYIKTQLSSSDLKSTLTNTPLYYVLATPYLSLIEDNNLIEQLDNLQNAMSYSGTTNINQVNDDLPFNMSIKAMVEGSNAVVVNNIGNATSKPLIELEGSGNIDIYLNGNQILQANVEDKMNIDIDTLEAYNPDTMTLLNRQVIGNYNSMTLQPGNNIIKMSGDLTTATISNYTRWL